MVSLCFQVKPKERRKGDVPSTLSDEKCNLAGNIKSDEKPNIFQKSVKITNKLAQQSAVINHESLPTLGSDFASKDIKKINAKNRKANPYSRDHQAKEQFDHEDKGVISYAEEKPNHDSCTPLSEQDFFGSPLMNSTKCMESEEENDDYLIAAEYVETMMGMSVIDLNSTNISTKKDAARKKGTIKQINIKASSYTAEDFGFISDETDVSPDALMPTESKRSRVVSKGERFSKTSRIKIESEAKTHSTHRSKRFSSNSNESESVSKIPAQTKVDSANVSRQKKGSVKAQNSKVTVSSNYSRFGKSPVTPCSNSEGDSLVTTPTNNSKTKQPSTRMSKLTPLNYKEKKPKIYDGFYRGPGRRKGRKRKNGEKAPLALSGAERTSESDTHTTATSKSSTTPKADPQSLTSVPKAVNPLMLVPAPILMNPKSLQAVMTLQSNSTPQNNAFQRALSPNYHTVQRNLFQHQGRNFQINVVDKKEKSFFTSETNDSGLEVSQRKSPPGRNKFRAGDHRRAAAQNNASLRSSQITEIEAVVSNCDIWNDFVDLVCCRILPESARKNNKQHQGRIETIFSIIMSPSSSFKTDNEGFVMSKLCQVMREREAENTTKSIKIVTNINEQNYKDVLGQDIIDLIPPFIITRLFTEWPHNS